MNEGTEVYLRTDTKRRVAGFIVKDLGGKPGRHRYTVAWVGTSAKPTDHDEADLVAAGGARNVVTGNTGGNVIQAQTIVGGVHLNSNGK